MFNHVQLFSGLGKGWALALVETEREGYVLANSFGINGNVLQFLIGGSTMQRLGREMHWNQYRLDKKGKIILSLAEILNFVIMFCNILSKDV